MILCDRQIRKLALAGMIEPFVDGQVRERDGQKLISYGLSSAGYDLRLGTEFATPFKKAIGGIDPKSLDAKDWCIQQADEPTMIEPGSHVLGCSVEYLRIPDDVMATAIGKSTYARCGLIVNVTPLEPGLLVLLCLAMRSGSGK